MISIPDGLLERLDSLARGRQETRSGFLQQLVERELKGDAEQRRQEAKELLDKAIVRGGMGGEAVRLIREDRESH